MMRFWYTLALCLAYIVYLPKSIWDLLLTRKGRESLLYRLGMRFPKLRLENKPTLWIHAVSVGEAKLVKPLIETLNEHHKQDLNIVVSTTTETGKGELLRTLPEFENHFYLPWDLPWINAKLIKLIKPDVFVLIEGDFWLNLLALLKKSEVKTLLVNGKISEGSLRGYNRLRQFSAKLFSQIDLFSMQNDQYLSRLRSLNVSEEKLKIGGNMKFDNLQSVVPDSEKDGLRKEFGIQSIDFVITIGSTHKDEEKLILDQLQNLQRANSNIVLLIVPRHPERFTLVKQLIKRDFSKVSYRISVVDKMGILTSCYSISDLAIVGGSFVDIGGHNLLEPISQHVPVIFGPYTHKQNEMKDLLEEASLGTEVCKLSDLKSVVEKQINRDQSEQKRFVKQSTVLLGKIRGSTRVNADYIHSFLSAD